jgi:Pyridoxamine 5'-phosphate oxidase
MAEIPASHYDLLDGEVATLATVGPDGRPQVSEVWFLRDGDSVDLSLSDAGPGERRRHARLISPARPHRPRPAPRPGPGPAGSRR